MVTDLKLTAGIKYILEMIFMIQWKPMLCPLLEPSRQDGSTMSRRDGSNEGSQHVFFMEKYGKYGKFVYPFLILSGALI